MLRKAVIHIGFWLGVALGAGPALALPIDCTIRLDLADATSRNVFLWFERSDADAPTNTPGVLDFGESAFSEIPEPEAFVLMGSGLIGLAMFSRRRRRAG